MNDRELFGADVDDVTGSDLMHSFGMLLSEQNPTFLERDERFMTWLSRDLRRRPPEPGDWDALRVSRTRRRILARVWGERSGVADGGDVPSVREVQPATIAQSIDDAMHARCAPMTSLAAAAGEGREIWDEECEQWLELPPSVESGKFVALRVAGDSMTPLFHDGDTILVRLGKDVRRDSVIVARRPESGYVVKRVGRLLARAIELVSLNPEYEPVLLPRSEDAILGTVVMRWCVHAGEALPLR